MSRRLAEITDWPERGAAAHWSVTTLARDCDASLAQLERHFLETWGQTPQEWLQAERLRRACELLERCERIKDIAEKLGYAHQRNFSTAFTRHFGYSPREHVGTVSKDEGREPVPVGRATSPQAAKSEIGNRKSEIGNRKSEIGNRKLE